MLSLPPPQSADRLLLTHVVTDKGPDDDASEGDDDVSIMWADRLFVARQCDRGDTETHHILAMGGTLVGTGGNITNTVMARLTKVVDCEELEDDDRACTPIPRPTLASGGSYDCPAITLTAFADLASIAVSGSAASSASSRRRLAVKPSRPTRTTAWLSRLLKRVKAAFSSPAPTTSAAPQLGARHESSRRRRMTTSDSSCCSGCDAASAQDASASATTSRRLREEDDPYMFSASAAAASTSGYTEGTSTTSVSGKVRYANSNN